MKIDEACIDHNALRLINEIVGSPYEFGDVRSVVSRQTSMSGFCMILQISAQTVERG